MIVILTALLSNIVFRSAILRDFNNYASGVTEDQFHWIVLTTEGSYAEGKWNTRALADALHWATMLGMDTKIVGADGQDVLTSEEVMTILPDSMKERMSMLLNMHKTEGDFKAHPLYAEGKQVGTLLYRPFQKEEIEKKALTFKERTMTFLYITVGITGGGLLLLTLFLSQYLSRPLHELKTAAGKIASGDLSVRIAAASKDEVGNVAEMFNHMAESLQREEQLRKRLMSNIAHELRTPLTIMKTQVEAISDGLIEREKGLENIRSEIDDFINLVKGIEDVTAAEASFFTKARETEINLKEFLVGIADELSPAYTERGLSVRVKNQDSTVVFADDEKLAKIVRNLLSNSLKYTEKGGAVIDYGKENGGFFIEINDSGRGIPESEIPRIFDRFYRVNKVQSEGLGLGLAIVKELVDVMGGKITVRSTVNEGTTFRISLKSSSRKA